jgi:hypothetical protein
MNTNLKVKMINFLSLAFKSKRNIKMYHTRSIYQYKTFASNRGGASMLTALARLTIWKTNNKKAPVLLSWNQRGHLRRRENLKSHILNCEEGRFTQHISSRIQALNNQIFFQLSKKKYANTYYCNIMIQYFHVLRFEIYIKQAASLR